MADSVDEAWSLRQSKTTDDTDDHGFLLSKQSSKYVFLFCVISEICGFDRQYSFWHLTSSQHIK
jgi:hypothetical protein